MDLVIAAAVLFGFFYYKGGLRLVAMLAIPFMLLLALFHLASRLLGKRRPHRDEPVASQKVDRPDSERLGGD